jgi:hypothetical protein
MYAAFALHWPKPPQALQFSLLSLQLLLTQTLQLRAQF